MEFNAYVAKFREAHLAYYEQLSDKLDISESKECYNSVMFSASDLNARSLVGTSSRCAILE